MNPPAASCRIEVMPLVRPSSTRETNSSTIALTTPALVGRDGFVYTSIFIGSGCDIICIEYCAISGDDALRESCGDDDRGGGLVIVNLTASRFGVGCGGGFH